MNTGRKSFLAVCLTALLLLFLLPASGLAAESYSADTMRLLRYEGDVTILNTEGVPRFVMEDVRFSSGETMQTGAESLASVGMDDTKIVTLDADTEVQFVQEDQHIRLNLNKGTLFLDVQESLDENEGLDIQTTTMTVGIRGTIVFAREDPDALGKPGMTTFGVLEGTAEISYTDPAGASRRLPVPAGHKLTILQPETEGAGVSPVLSPITQEDIKGFITEVVQADPVLQTRVEPVLTGSNTETDDLFPAEGDWIYPGTVTLVAQSASKLYDGLPLTRTTNALVYDLPAGLSIDVTATGSQTDAGTHDNVISSWTIRNAANQDVTSHFPSVETIPGTLVVKQVPLTVWTGSAEKVYDGTPLVCEEAEIKTIQGYVAEEPAWLNTSLVTQTALGSERMVAVSGHTFVQSTNPLTGETVETDLPVGFSLSVLLHKGENDEQSLEFKIEAVSEEELPEEVLRLYADNPDMLARACADAGWDPELIAQLIAALPPVEETAAVDSAGLQVAPETGEQLMVDSASVRIQVDSGITNYNSRPLTEREAKFTPITLDSRIVVTATGSRTEVGSSPNTYEINWNGANPNNYILSEDLGTLTVTAAPEAQAMPAVTFTASSASKVYDGTPLTSADVTASGLPKGYTFSAKVSSSLTETGTAENKVSSVTILDPSGKDVTSQFKNITYKTGTLTVEPLSVSVASGSNTATYSGSAYIPEPVLTYENGPHAGETVTAVRIADSRLLRIAAAGGMPAPMSSVASFRFTLFTGDTVDITASGTGADAGTYTVTYSLSSSSASVSFAGSSVTSSKVVIQPADVTVTVTGNTATLEYSSGEYQIEGYDVSISNPLYLKSYFTFSGSAVAAGTVPGTYSMGLSESMFSNTNANFDVTFAVTDGVLTVTKNSTPVTIRLNDYSEQYSGAEVFGYNADSTVTGLNNDRYWAYAIGGASLTDVGSVENPVVDYAIGLRTGDETDVTEYFSNVTLVPGTLTVTPVSLSVITPSDTRTYDGISLPETTDQPTLTGLLPGETAEIELEQNQITDAGSKPNTYIIQWITAKVKNYIVASESLGTLTVGKRPLTLTSASDSKPYDGTPLTNHEVTAGGGGFAYGEGFTYSFTGSQTDVGTSENTFTYAPDSGTKAENYDISASYGTLEVTPREVTVTVTGKTETRAYTGEAQTLKDYSLTISDDLYKPEYVTFTGSGAVGTDPGTYDMGLEPAQFTNTNDNFHVTFVIGSDGALTIGPMDVTVTITGHTSTCEYDGDEHFVEGYDATSSTPLFAAGNIDIDDAAETGGRNPGTYYMGLDADRFHSLDDTGRFNVNFVVTDGSLTITKNTSTAITISTGSFSTTYDGQRHTYEEAEPSVTGLNEDQYYIQLFSDTELTGVGVATIKLTYTITRISDGVNATSFFDNVTTNSGMLTVSPAPLTITTPTESKVYDGQYLPATTDRPTITGFVNDEYVDASVPRNQLLQPGTKDNEYAIEWTNADEGNYTQNATLGTLTITKLSITVVDNGTNMSVKFNNGPHENETAAMTLTLADGSSSSQTVEEYTLNLYTGDGLLVRRITTYSGGTGTVTYEYTLSNAECFDVTLPASYMVSTVID